MNDLSKAYSPFWAIFLFFIMVIIFDLNQTVKLHRSKLEAMQEYAQALKLQPQARAQVKWAFAMRDDLLRLAPGDPAASQIVAELHLHAVKPGP